MAVTTEAILALIAAESGIDQAALRDDATFQELDIGSLDVVSVLFRIEDEFGVVIEPDSITPSATLSDFVELVSSRAR